MAEFLAWRIMDEKLTFIKVPASLKDKVKQILVDAGVGHLAEEK